MCSNEDLKELGVGMGPRKKLSSFISQENERQKLAKERRAREAAERLEKERQAAAKEVVDSASDVFGVKIIKGLAGTGQTHVEYPQLHFTPQHLFALGSPIGLFLTVRSVQWDPGVWRRGEGEGSGGGEVLAKGGGWWVLARDGWGAEPIVSVCWYSSQLARLYALYE